MKIIVNDANILIDLVVLKILPYFFQLKFQFHTTEIILEELVDAQKEALLPYIETGHLIVDSITDEDLTEILSIMASKPTLSMQDCSAFCLARKKKATLLTSDNLLRKYAQMQKLDVHGHLWLFDNLVDNDILSGNRAIIKLTELCSVINPKLGLPEEECRKRINMWKKL